MSIAPKLTITIRSAFVLESDPGMRKMISNYLGATGIEKIDFCSENGSLPSESKDIPDLYVIDWKSKSPSGKDLYKSIRANLKSESSLIILTSGSITKDELTLAISDQNAKFILKPFSEEVILKALDDLTRNQLRGHGGKGNFTIMKGEALSNGLELSIFKSDGSAGNGLQIEKRLNDPEFSINQETRKITDGSDIKVRVQKHAEFEFENKKANVDGFEFNKAAIPFGQNNSTKQEGSEENTYHLAFASPQPGSFELTSKSEIKQLDLEFAEEKNSGKIPSNLPIDSDENPVLGEMADPPSVPHSPSEEKTSKTESYIEYVDHKIQSLKSLSVAPFEKAIIVDSDIIIAKTIKTYLTHLGVRHIEILSGGNEAWDALQSNDYDLIIMDWKLRGISGLCLYNRIRNYPKLAHTPTVVLCGFVGKEDFRLLDEMSSTSFLEKPFQLAVFEKSMRSTQVSSEVDIILAEIAGQLIEKSPRKNAELLKEIVVTAKRTGHHFKFLVAAASYFMHLKNYVLAEAIWELAIKINPKSVAVMTELAKTNLRLNRPMKSLALLNQADRFAPGNIERLCLMGESGLALFETDKARAYFLKALQIDSNQNIAHAGITVADNLKDYLDVNKNYKPLNIRLASTLNVVGMAYIRNEEVDRGIEQYKSALCFIHDSATLSKLQFNLGLAYLRKGDRKNAQNYLFESMGNADEFFLKPGVLHAKLASGINFKRTVEETSYELDEDHQAHFV